uniref:Uncharacterized protein n=1 Tax=Leersia perrieri TaxID=77586 RepID=A0A0D9XRN8_9ORYZ
MRLAVVTALLSFFFFLLFAAVAGGSLTRTNVARLPGFDGVLPSRLETGYVTVDEENGAELFYYFIESEADPSTDPVLLWLTGGDRCSVLSGLLLEIGAQHAHACTDRFGHYGDLPRLRYHPYTWTKGYDVGDLSASMQLIKLLREVCALFSDIEDGAKPMFNLKIIMEHCKGEDYDNPKNEICRQGLARFESG